MSENGYEKGDMKEIRFLEKKVFYRALKHSQMS
jgi:hypothetical protein